MGGIFPELLGGSLRRKLDNYIILLLSLAFRYWAGLVKHYEEWLLSLNSEHFASCISVRCAGVILAVQSLNLRQYAELWYDLIARISSYCY